MLAAVLLLTGMPVSPARADVARERQIKAAFVYNFTKYVEWPRGHFGDATEPVVLGVLGNDSFSDALTEAVSARTINGRKVVVRLLTDAKQAASADVLFVPDGEEPRFAAAVPALRGAGVLTVGESGQFAELGGVITFVVRDHKVRFEINTAEAERNGLKISAQLQKLALPAPRKP
ncbi:MAG TPA: YfiR family protein [Opitutaceae bacterium]